jgi:protein-disulfide isomerase/uncharacterized membrane protein
MQPTSRSALAVILIAALGLGIGLVIQSVQQQLDADVTYASFCNVNATVNCDVVLGSTYAKLGGISVALLASLYYAALLVAGIVVARSNSASRRASLGQAIFFAACAGLLFSLYLAFVSVSVLNSICLLCSALYVVAVGMLIAGWMLRRNTQRLRSKTGGTQSRQERWIWGVTAGVTAVFAGTIGFQLLSGNVALSAEGIRTERPDFYRWYYSRPVTDVSAEGRNVRGAPDASVTIVEFSDFGCSHCAAFDRNVGELLRGDNADVRLVFRYFPLDSGCNPAISGGSDAGRCDAAVAAECAAEQQKFWQYARVLFDNRPRFSSSDLQDYATEVGLDLTAFDSCVKGEAARARVEHDAKDGATLGINSTPTIFINGRRIEGDLGEDLRTALILARSKG